MHEQLVALLRVEARVGAQPVQELGEAAGEAGRRDFRIRRAADARDFGESDVVDIVRGERLRGVAAREARVVVAAAFDRRDAEAGPRRRQILRLEKAQPRLARGTTASVMMRSARLRTAACSAAGRLRQATQREEQWLVLQRKRGEVMRGARVAAAQHAPSCPSWGEQGPRLSICPAATPDDQERERLVRAIEGSRSMGEAAQVLGMARSTLYRQMARHGVQAHRVVQP